MNIQVAVLDAGGYAECPDCAAKIHCSTVGFANLEILKSDTEQLPKKWVC